MSFSKDFHKNWESFCSSKEQRRQTAEFSVRQVQAERNIAIARISGASTLQ